MENLIAIIPARGGSKGLPGKNLLDLHGHPLIAWSILFARETGKFNRIIGSKSRCVSCHEDDVIENNFSIN